MRHHVEERVSSVHRNRSSACGRDRAQPIYSSLRVEADRDRRVRTIANSRKTNVGALVGQRQAPATVADETELGRQSPERLFGRKHSRELPAAAADIKDLGRVDPREWADHEV